MGIRQLQTFIQKCVPNGYINISLNDECEEFEREKNARPILVIDVDGLIRSLIKDQKEIICGLRHNKIYDVTDKLLKNLSQIADLVFYIDDLPCAAKSQEKLRRKNDRYEKSLKIVDKVLNAHSVDEIARDKESMPPPTSHKKIVLHIAEIYGTLTKTIDKECDTEMALFASQNSRVLAILADDTDFLIYPGNWRYFSLREMDQSTLETKEYNRCALRECLKLNDKQLVLLSILNGNDMICFDDTYQFHRSLIRQRNNPAPRFPAIAEYIRSHDSDLLGSPNLYENVAFVIFGSNSEKYVSIVTESFDFYNTEFEARRIKDETEIFCRENCHFVFTILNYALKSFTSDIIDQRHSSDNYFESINYLFSKQIGIVLKDKPPRGYTICTRLSHSDKKYKFIEIDPVFPEYSQPPLIELLDRKNFPQHDILRFKLLKWMINEEKLKDVNFESIPNNIFLDILVLIYMVYEKFISVVEADIILLSLKLVRDDAVPDDLKPPERMNTRAFFTSILFSKCHRYVARSLQVAGLKELTKIHNFDGVLFHNLYKEHIIRRFNLTLLGDLEEYRYYA